MQIDIEDPLLPGRDESPTKYTSSDETLHIKCLLRYVDLEGLSDGRSMKTILPQIAPRKLVSTGHFFDSIHPTQYAFPQ